MTRIQAPSGVRVTVESGLGANVPRIDAQGRSEASVQVLVLEDFPDPKLARQLSPNGRAHWAARNDARLRVQLRVAAEAKLAGWQPMATARATFRYVLPTRRRVDLDNLSTGVTKAALDAFVRCGWLLDDDSQHVVSVTAEAVYEKGRRALEITLEPV